MDSRYIWYGVGVERSSHGHGVDVGVIEVESC